MEESGHVGFCDVMEFCGLVRVGTDPNRKSQL